MRSTPGTRLATRRVIVVNTCRNCWLFSPRGNCLQSCAASSRLDATLCVCTSRVVSREVEFYEVPMVSEYVCLLCVPITLTHWLRGGNEYRAELRDEIWLFGCRKRGSVPDQSFAWVLLSSQIQDILELSQRNRCVNMRVCYAFM